MGGVCPVAKLPMNQPVPAALHHLTRPSSPPLMKPLADLFADGLGRHETLHTSPVSWMVDTAARAAKSHTLMVLSAELGIPN